jgi:hypothetical protein
MPHSVSCPPICMRHDPDEVDAHRIGIDMMLVHIHECRPLQCSPLHDTEGIEWMSMTLIFPIAYFDEYHPFAITGDDIDLSSLDLIVLLEHDESLRLEVLHGECFSGISDAAARYHRSIAYVSLGTQQATPGTPLQSLDAA